MPLLGVFLFDLLVAPKQVAQLRRPWEQLTVC